jgi:hypothetical protein
MCPCQLVLVHVFFYYVHDIEDNLVFDTVFDKNNKEHVGREDHNVLSNPDYYTRYIGSLWTAHHATGSPPPIERYPTVSSIP